MQEQPGSVQKRSFGSSLLMIGLLVAVAATAVWANLWKSNLRIVDVRVGGNTIVDEKEILLLSGISKGQRLYGIDLLAAQRRITENAFIKSAAVNREAPNRVFITVQERMPIAAVVLDKIEYLDADGMVLPPTHSEHILDLPVMTGVFLPEEFVPGRQITRSEAKEALEVLATAQQLGDELYCLISEVRIESGRDPVFYTAESGVPIVFGCGDVAAKLVKFGGFWKAIVLHHWAHELACVDLRFQDQVVVRWNHDKEETQAMKAVVEKSAKAKES
jgi:cell division protein FtsQ